jgi:hypothetical protein
LRFTLSGKCIATLKKSGFSHKNIFPHPWNITILMSNNKKPMICHQSKFIWRYITLPYHLQIVTFYPSWSLSSLIDVNQRNNVIPTPPQKIHQMENNKHKNTTKGCGNTKLP